MEENFNLDTIKEVWQKQTQTHQYSKDEIFKMMKRKSITSVKWIFYISLAEVLLGLGMYIYVFWDSGILHFHNQMLKTMGSFGYFYEVIYMLIGVVNLVFLYLFFRSYTQVSAISNVKRLTESIINLKENVSKFIYFNISISFVLLGILLYFKFEESSFNLQSKEGIILIIASTLTITVMLGVIWLYYYLLYGTFVRRLRNNLKELSKLEQ